MESTATAASNRVYQDFDPSAEWAPETFADTLMVYLPGFRKEQLKVQVTSSNNLKISGARQLNENTWSRFRKEIPIPSNYDTKGITANFEKGILHVRNPKLIVPDSPAPPEFSKPTLEQSLKSPNPPQETPKPTMEVASKTRENQKSIEQEPPKPSKPLQEPSEPENLRKEEPSKALEAPKSQNLPQETPKRTKEEPSKALEVPKSQNTPQETPKVTKEEPSKLEKPRTEKEEKEQVKGPRKVTKNDATSEQEKAGKIEKAGAFPEINESGSGKFVMENYKNSVSGFMKEMKNARNATNMVLAILFVLVIVLYIKNAVRNFMKSENYDL